MPFPRKLLNDGEETVVDIRPHWWFLVWPSLTLLAVLVLGVFMLGAVDVTAARWLAGLGVLAALGWFVVRYLRWININFVVTTDRVIYRSGVLAKHGIEIPLERVNTVFFNQGVFERMIGAGDLAIESAGESGRSEFTDIRRPNLVQNEIYRQMEDNENRKFDRINRGAPSISVAEQLEKLEGLYQRGMLSQEEFEAQKASLLRQ